MDYGYPPPVYGYDANAGQGYKNLSTAYWLAVLVGFVGAHRFYLGQIKSGIIYGVLTVAWLWLWLGLHSQSNWIPQIITTLWLLVDLTRLPQWVKSYNASLSRMSARTPRSRW